MWCLIVSIPDICPLSYFLYPETFSDPNLSKFILKLRNPDFLTQLTLDAAKILYTESIVAEELGSLELFSREYIYRIHVKRVVALKRVSKT